MKKTQLYVITSFFIIFTVTDSQAAVGRKQDGLEQKSRIEQNQRDALAFQGKVRLVEVSQKLGLPAAEVAKFFKEEIDSGKANMLAWAELLQGITTIKRNATKEDFQKQDIMARNLRSYVQIRKSKLANDLHIRESDLLDIQKNFTLDQQTNFGKVLQRASELSNSGKLVSMDAAFEQALKETGYYNKYRSCKI